MFRLFGGILIVVAFADAVQVSAEEVSREQMKGVDEQVQDIKKDVLSISTELKLLEEKLLYPSNTEISLFVSLAGDAFRVDSLGISIDGSAVTQHIYSFKELEALKAGGMQRIYTGNVRTGGHELRVDLRGKSASGKDYSETRTYKIEKGVGPELLEIALSGDAGTSKRIDFKDW